MKISTSGLRRREIHRRAVRKPYCPTDEIFVSSVTIYEAAPILILLLFGMIISLIIFAIEHLIFHATNSKRTVDGKFHKRNKILLQAKIAPKGKNLISHFPQANSLLHKILMRK
jgi:hypothetical protein